jgi:hypothetical protein
VLVISFVGSLNLVALPDGQISDQRLVKSSVTPQQLLLALSLHLALLNCREYHGVSLILSECLG